jgi:hypothetical protein
MAAQRSSRQRDCLVADSAAAMAAVKSGVSRRVLTSELLTVVAAEAI